MKDHPQKKRTWCLALTFTLAVLSQSPGEDDGQILESQFLRLELDTKDLAKIQAVVYRPASLRFTRVTASEAAVFQDGRTVAISGFAVKDGGPGEPLSLTLETSLPANPLIGSRPGTQVEFPYFRHDDTSQLRISKTYQLSTQEPVLEIGYSITNAGAKPVTFCLRLDRKFALERTALTTLLPTVEGVRPARKGYFYDLPGAWIASVGPGLAVVTELDWAMTSCLSATGAVTTEHTLAPGASWSTATRTRFYKGLDHLAGLAGGIAADLVFPVAPDVPVRDPKRRTIEDDLEEAEEGIDGGGAGGGADELNPVLTRKAFLPGKPISFQARLVSHRARRVALKGRASLHLGAEEMDLGSAEAPLAAGTPAEVSLSFTPRIAGTWVLHFDVIEDGKPIGGIEEPLVVDYPTGFYMPGLKAQGEKVGREFDRYRAERFRKPGSYDQHSLSWKMTEEIQSPHITYARPLSDGPLRTLMCIFFRRSREAIDLKLRLDLDLDCVLVGGHGYRAQPGAEKTIKEKEVLRAPDDETLAMKMALNNKPEVILFAASFWDWFYPDVQQEILRQVREGAGLVLYPPLGLSPELEALDEFRETSKGKVTVLQGRAAVGPDPLFASSEVLTEALSQELILAARGEPEAKVSWSPEEEITREYRVAVSNRSEQPFTGQIEVVAHFNLPRTFPQAYRGSPYSIYAEMAKVSRPLALKENERKEIVIPFPEVPTGKYRTFLILKGSDGGTVSWLSRDQAAEGPLTMENLAVSHVAGERLRLERTDEIRIAFDLAKRGEAEVGGTVAYLLGEDRSQRIVVQQSRPVELKDGKASVAFKAPLARALHRLFILRVGVKSNGLIVAEQRVPVLVGREPGRENKYRFTVLDNEDSFSYAHIQLDDQVQAWDPMPWAWYDMRGYVFGGYTNDPFALPKQVQEKIERAKKYAEFEKALPGGPKVELKKRQDDDEFEEDDDLEELIETEEEQEEQAKQPKKEPEKPIFVRKPCYNDPKFREVQFAKACKAAEECSAGWPQRILIVDEYLYGPENACQCEHCQVAFRRYLERSYGTLARLNREWGAKLKSWEEASLYDLDYEPKPPPREQWPRMLDTLTYKTVSLTDFSEALSAEARKIDPEIEFGFSGCYKMDIFNGTEFWLMSQVGKFHLVYRDTEEWQSFVGSENAHSWSSGYGRNYNPSQQKALPWAYLFRGQWRLGHFTSQTYPMAGPDSRLHPGPAAFFGALGEIHRGYDELLLGHEVRDPIAIHWSGPSFFLCGIEQWCKTEDPKKAGDLQRWCTHSVPRHGFRPYYLPYGQLEKGGLAFWGPPKIIFLQYSNAMSEKECETLRKYVEGGGLLVGGVDTATRTEHGYPYAKPPLDEVFGIRRTGEFQEVVARKGDEDHTNDVVLKLPGRDEELKFNPYFVGPPNIEATSAKPCGRWGTDQAGGPVFLVNQFGKGTAIYLNFPLLNTFPEARNTIASWLYERAGVKRFATAEGCKLSPFRDGEAFYACLQLGYGFPPEFYGKRSRECQISLEEARHVYDARHGKYLGKTDRFRPEFGDHSIAIYSCLPYQVKGITIQPPQQAKQGDTVRCAVRVEIDGDQPARHVLHVDAYQPDGECRDLLSYSIITRDGKGAVELPLAWNAPVGRWRLVVRDVATGTQAEAPFAVAQR